MWKGNCRQFGSLAQVTELEVTTSDWNAVLSDSTAHHLSNKSLSSPGPLTELFPPSSSPGPAHPRGCNWEVRDALKQKGGAGSIRINLQWTQNILLEIKYYHFLLLFLFLWMIFGGVWGEELDSSAINILPTSFSKSSQNSCRESNVRTCNAVLGTSYSEWAPLCIFSLGIFLKRRHFPFIS